MASPDVQIIRDGTTDVPLNYTLPQSAGLQPLAVNAVFGGSAAAGDYLPCVVIIGASGTVIARTAADSTVTAGDDAEVSWFPGVKNSAAGVATLPYLNDSLLTQGTNTTHAIPSGAVTAIPWDTYTSAPGYGKIFGLTPTTDNPVTFVEFGRVVVTVTVNWPAAAYDRYVELTVGAPSAIEYISNPRVRNATTPDGDRQTLTAVINGDPFNPTTITTNVFQASGVNRSITAGISFHSIPYGVAPYVVP